MNISTERSSLIKEIKEVEDISLLRVVKAVLHYGLKNEGRISIAQYNKELREAGARIDRGDFFTQDEVEKMAKEW